jgi:hypothetical protein
MTTTWFQATNRCQFDPKLSFCPFVPAYFLFHITIFWQSPLKFGTAETNSDLLVNFLLVLLIYYNILTIQNNMKHSDSPYLVLLIYYNILTVTAEIWKLIRWRNHRIWHRLVNFNSVTQEYLQVSPATVKSLGVGGFGFMEWSGSIISLSNFYLVCRI